MRAIPLGMHWSLETEVDMRSNGKFGLIALCCIGLSCSSTPDRDGAIAESRAAITAVPSRIGEQGFEEHVPV